MSKKADAAEDRLLVEIWCYQCRGRPNEGRDPVGIVRRNPEGQLAFEGILGVDMDPKVRLGILKALRAAKGPRRPYLGVGVAKVLLEGLHDEENDWPPRARCTLHDLDELDPEYLIAAARRAETQRGKPEKCYIHR